MSDMQNGEDNIFYDPEDDVLRPLPTSSGTRQENPRDRVGAGLIIAGVLAWAIVWIITGIWWTIFMIFPTELLILIVIVHLAGWSKSFNGRRG